MRPDFRLCDKCKTGRAPEHSTIFAATDRLMDAAGSMEDIGVEMDLCHACAILAIKHLLREDGKATRQDYALGKRAAVFIGKEWMP